MSAGNEKVPSSALMSAGRYPVVDQGQNLVAGYTDDASALCRASVPVIVFGDHTRCFKFVDFPFCMGADGTKVLRPISGDDPKYLYHFLRQAPLKEAGYSRHFKFLKELEVPLPPLAEQRRIADVLDRAEALRAKRRGAIDLLAQLPQAAFTAAFGDPVSNPRNYESRSLIEVVDADRPITYGILMPGEDQAEGVPYVRVVDLRNGAIKLSTIRRTTRQIDGAYRRSRLRTGDLLMSIRGHVGRTALVPPELDGGNITQDTARLAIHGSAATFVRECLRTPALQRWMAQHTKGVAVRGINLTDVKRIPIVQPPIDEQRCFARFVDQVDSELARQRASLKHLDSLLASLQHRAFGGEL